MSNDDLDPRTEQRLRDALAATAAGVAPGGEGLMRIQQRIGEQRGQRWLRPLAIVGSMAVVAGIVVGGVALAHHNSGSGKMPPADGGVSPSATPTDTSAPVDNTTYPTQAIFPYTTASAEASWEQEFAQGNSPWVSSPTAVTQSWIEYYLKEKGQFSYSAQTSAGSSDVTVSRGIGGTDHPVSIVHLVRYHHAWLVTGASDPQSQLTIASPAPDSSVTSPVTVTGPGYGVDEAATIEVRDATTPALFGHANTGGFGNGTAQWSASVPFNATSDTGVIVATVASAADGDVGTLTAEKVTFASPTAIDQSGTFYAVQGGAIEHFSGGGADLGPVADTSNDGTVVEVKQVGDTLYYTTGTKDCATELRSVPSSGGSSSLVLNARSGYGITGFDVTSGGAVAYFETGCGSSAGKGVLVFQTATNQARALDFPSLPPTIVGDPVWESDGVHVDAFVRTGNMGYLARYDSTNGTSTTPSTNACPGYDINNGMPGAITTAPDGTLYIAVQTGSSMQVLSCDGGKTNVEMTVSQNDTPASLSVNSAGNILLGDVNGHLWSQLGSLQAGISIGGGGVTSATW